MLLLEKGDNPEIDASKHLDQDRVQKHQLLNGDVQWDASLGRLDVNGDVMILDSFLNNKKDSHS